MAKVIKSTNDIERSSRRRITAEDFTPSNLVQEIVSKLTSYNKNALDAKQTILDPACGNGNMLVVILESRLKAGLNPLESLSTLYGCDIMEDNINECKERLLTIAYPNKNPPQKAIDILDKHIVHTPLKIYPNGSLDYLNRDDAFEGKEEKNLIAKLVAKKVAKKVVKKSVKQKQEELIFAEFQ